jgi:hypothetical protein
MCATHCTICWRGDNDLVPLPEDSLQGVIGDVVVKARQEQVHRQRHPQLALRQQTGWQQCDPDAPATTATGVLGAHRPPDHQRGRHVLQFLADFLADTLGRASAMRTRFKAGGFQHHRLTFQVTTLTDAQIYPVDEIIALYARRWRLELCLRDLKTTMGLEELRCKTPDMAEKELLAYLVAHNLIRCVMAEAVARYAVDLERVSFKGSVDALRQYSAAMDRARNRKMRRQLWEDLLWNLARDLVRLRPGREEPRAVKRRPKPCPLLNNPRRYFQEISHRSRYWKGRPRKYRGLN